MVNFGNISIADLRLGASQVKALYLGSEQMWGGEEPGPVADWLCFTAEQSNSTVHLDKLDDSSGSTPEISLEYSTDGSTWNDYTWSGNTGATLTLANVGDKIYMRAKNENSNLASGISHWHQFTMSGKIAASGNIQTLLKADGSRTDAPTYCYLNMFKGCTSLTTAPALPATTLVQGCYWSMFEGCTSLTTAPALPATTLGGSCYYQMFKGCTSLTQASALPATTLFSSSYANMFYGCTSLTTAPVISATTLADSSCMAMFEGCTSLTTAPALPATTLAESCYMSMFRDCTSLTSAPILSAETLAKYCYSYMFQNCSSLSSVEVRFSSWKSGATTNWLYGVAASGTFTCPEELPDTRGGSNIPVGWTVAHPVVAEPLCFTAEEANSTVYLDKNGFPNAISLETSTNGSTWTDYSWSGWIGDTLTLANVGDKVYFRAKNENQTIGSSDSIYYTFVMTGKIAASGNIQTLLKADGSRTDAPTYCYYNMFKGCTALTTAPSLPATTLASSCYGCMFYDCTSLTTAPELPATTLAPNCYEFMFMNCKSLTTAPALPATTLAERCYQSMFYGCSKLASMDVSFTVWSQTYATSEWLNGVAATGTFTCPAALPDTRGISNIPTGWTKVDAA